MRINPDRLKPGDVIASLGTVLNVTKNCKSENAYNVHYLSFSGEEKSERLSKRSTVYTVTDYHLIDSLTSINPQESPSWNSNARLSKG